MKKRSFWQRGNRGFLISMILLVAVMVYVTITQIQLAQEKKVVREVTEQVQDIVVDMLDMPLADMQKLQDQVQAAAYRDNLKKELSDLFVKDSSYLDDAADQIMTMLATSIANEQELSSLKEKRDFSSINIDENTAVADLDITYDAKGSWLVYNQETDEMENQTHDTEMFFYCQISLLQEEGAWKIYRIHSMDHYSHY